MNGSADLIKPHVTTSGLLVIKGSSCSGSEAPILVDEVCAIQPETFTETSN